MTKNLAIYLPRRYSEFVPEKKGNEFDSSTGTGRIGRAKRLFHACFIAPFLWAAVAGRLRPAGFLVHRSVNPAICCPPRLTAGRSSETYKEPAMSTNKKSLFPICSSATDSSAFLLGTISESEIQTLLHLRAFPDDLRAGMQKTIAATAQRYCIRPRLVLLNTAIQGACHD